MSHVNRQILLASRPVGEPVAENFRLVETPVAPLADGQVLVRHHFLSLDPYMRGRMSDAKSYAAPQPLNMPKDGGGLKKETLATLEHFKAGDKVRIAWTWSERRRIDSIEALGAAK